MGFIVLNIYELNSRELDLVLKVQSWKLQKHSWMIFFVLQKYPEIFYFNYL